MKLSFFSLSKKAQAKPSASVTAAVHGGDEAEESSKVYLREFDDTEARSTDPGLNHVIPPKANDWRPLNKIKNLNPRLQTDDEQPSLQFEVVPPSATDPTRSMSYCLNMRKSGSNPNSDILPCTDSSDVVDPMLRKLREDLKRLPEDVGFDQYNDMPVEEFGRAYMAGYGWVEGRGIGWNAKEDVKVVEYTGRTARQGLGFTGQPPEIPLRVYQDNGRKKASGERERTGKRKEDLTWGKK